MRIRAQLRARAPEIFIVWLGIMLPTAFLGMMWGIAYLLGRRSLVPSMVAHFLNDATALPWILFFMVAMR